MHPRTATVLAAVCALFVSCEGDVLQRMKDHARTKPYEELRPLSPDGTQSQEQWAETLAAREVPLLTSELMATGRKQFDIFCGTCHGLLGDGVSIVSTKMTLRPPPSLLDLPARTDADWFQVVTEGRGLMPSYAAELSVRQRWAVIAYVRALRLSQNAPLVDLPSPERARLEAIPE